MQTRDFHSDFLYAQKALKRKQATFTHNQHKKRTRNSFQTLLKSIKSKQTIFYRRFQGAQKSKQENK